MNAWPNKRGERPNTCQWRAKPQASLIRPYMQYLPHGDYFHAALASERKVYDLSFVEKERLLIWGRFPCHPRTRLLPIESSFNISRN